MGKSLGLGSATFLAATLGLTYEDPSRRLALIERLCGFLKTPQSKQRLGQVDEKDLPIRLIRVKFQ